MYANDITVTGKLRQTESSVIIRRGDTLWHISRRVYGEGTRYTTIYLANQDKFPETSKEELAQLDAQITEKKSSLEEAKDKMKALQA